MTRPIGRDQLAAQFADKLAKAPPKGTRPARPADTPSPPDPPPGPQRPAVTPTAAPPAASAPSSPDGRPSPSSQRAERRGAPGGVVRGHLVPRTVHTAAQRAVLRARRARGRRLTWDGVLAEALELLDVRTALDRLDDVPDPGGQPPTMVQATITDQQDTAFAELRLDLSEATGTTVRLERLWALALILWTEAQSVE